MKCLVEKPCGRSRGVPSSHLHGRLLILLLLGGCQLLVGGSSGRGYRRVADTGTSSPTGLVQGQERINFHNGEVVAEQNECGHVYDILWSIPQVREQLGSTCSRKPDEVTDEDIPPWQMITALSHRFRTLPHEGENKTWANKECQGIE